MTPVLYYFITVIIEVHHECFKESVSFREIGEPTLRAEISSADSSGATSELTNSYRKQNLHKTQSFLLKRNLQLHFIPKCPYKYLKLEKSKHNPKKIIQNN